jgi:N-acetylmuramic acid 6-phosphate etherase
VQGIIAGGRRTLVRSREGVEDDRDAARQAVDKLKLNTADTLVGIAASGRTPYPLAALAEAKELGARTVFLVCNKIAKLPRYIDLVINPILGPELLTGSTRMKAGTACKLILNMITTAAMVRTGRCYGNLMVDLRATSAKLQERARRILVEVTGISYRSAGKLLEAARGEVKTALAMQLLGIEYRTARRQLAAVDGHLHRLISR